MHFDALGPRALEPDPPMGVVRDQGEAGARTCCLRILIVDDNIDAAEVLAMLLDHLGHQVKITHDGVSALEAARSFRPEVVLLDVGLPRIDGYEVARRLRQGPETKRALIVALTGYGRPEDLDRSRAAGFDVHLLKPVGMDALQAVLSGPLPVNEAEAGRS